MSDRAKVYLGDGVYATCDGFQVWLTTENGIETTNRVALDPQVLNAFLAYVAELRKPVEPRNDG